MALPKCVVLVQCFWVVCVGGARILGVFPLPSESHFTVYQHLMLALASRGHDIVIASPFFDASIKLSNYQQIKITAPYASLAKDLDLQSWVDKRYIPPEVHVIKWSLFLEELCKAQLSSPEVQQLIKSNTSFDVFIMEWLLGQPCLAGLTHKFPSSLIGISSLWVNGPGMDLLGNPVHPAYMPESNLHYDVSVTFWQRVHRTVFLVLKRLHWHYFTIPRQDAIARKYLGREMPYLGDMVKNISLLLVNQHFSTAYPRPNVPAVIELGGLHLRQPKPLPKELKDFLDGAISGAIYFSLGTNVRGDAMLPEKRQMFVDVFAQLPHFRVLWKYEGDSIPELPRNVMIRKWFPQQDVLAHPKVKLFIYQGGLQSTEEAIQAEVPVIGIPFLADQDVNVKKMRKSGAGLLLDYKYLNKELLLKAVEEVLLDSSYEENMKKLSKIVKDQPETPLERAIWWIEYVIRHKGARHLRSPALDLTWYEYLLLDVIAFLLAAVALSLWLLIFILKLLFRYLRSRRRRPKTD